MDNEAREAVKQLGEQSALIYDGAMIQCKNSKIAEKIVFLYFSAVMFGKDDSMKFILDMFGGDSE